MKPRIRTFAILLLGSLGVYGCGGGDPYDEADSLLFRKRYSPAIVKFDELLLENPTSVRALIGRGRAYAASGDMDRAMDDFSRAVELAPDRPEAFYRRAMVFEQLGEFGKAKADEDYAHSIDPEYRSAFLAMENAMLPVADEEDEEAVPEEGVSEETEKELTAAVSTSDTGQTTLRDLRVLRMPEPEPLPPQVDSEGRAAKLRSEFMSFDWQLTVEQVGDPLVDWRQIDDRLGPYQSSAQRRAATTTDAATKSTEKKPQEATTTKSPTGVARPAFKPGEAAPNPHVRAGAAATGNSTPASTVKPAPGTPIPTGAGNTARPTGSPFPQGPLRGTGRSNTPTK